VFDHLTLREGDADIGAREKAFSVATGARAREKVFCLGDGSRLPLLYQ
jgi:hypothetical protein